MDFNFSNYFRGFSKVFRGNSVLGIDIGSSSIKIAELTREGTKFSLINYAKLETKDYLDHPNRAIQTSSLKIVEKEAVYLLKEILIEMEYESFAATRALMTNDDPETMIVDIGAESTNVIFINNGKWEYNAQVDYGGVYLTQALNRGLGVSVSRAEILKKRKGLLGTGGESELSTLLTPFLDVIIQEVRRTRMTYETKSGKKIKQGILIGGGANLLGIEKYFNQNIDLPLLSPKLFNHINYPQELDFAIKSVSKDFAVAIGLAEKYFL